MPFALTSAKPYSSPTGFVDSALEKGLSVAILAVKECEVTVYVPVVSSKVHSIPSVPYLPCCVQGFPDKLPGPSSVLAVGINSYPDKQIQTAKGM